MSLQVTTAVWEGAHSLKGTPLLVLLALADHAHDDGWCWPSAPTIARMVRCEERQVRRIFEALESAGWVVIERRQGRSHRMRVVVDPGHSGARAKPKVSGVPRTFRASAPDISSSTPDTHMSDEPSVEPSLLNRQGTITPRSDSSELVLLDATTVEAHPATTGARFEEFWAVYPRKAAKPQGRKAYLVALKRTDHQTIVDGARRYADDPNRDPGYTKHPATWLNGDCWGDDPLPQRGGTRAVDPQAEILKREMEKAIAAEAARAPQNLQIGA